MKYLRMCALALTVVLLVATMTAALAADPPYYVRKATWYETVLASRENFQKHRGRLYAGLGVTLTPWHSVGPFTSSRPYADDFGPEKGVVLTASYGTGSLRWKEKAEWKDDEIIPLPEVDRSANYLYREISAARETTVTMYLGSDDGIRVWLNGSPVLEHEIDRGCARNQEMLSAKLRSGRNALLLKVNNGGGPTAFYFSLVDLDPATIWHLVQRDFASSAVKEEMEWEANDGIWTSDWQTGKYAELASRYTEAIMGVSASMGRKPSVPEVQGDSVGQLWNLRELYVEAHQVQKEVRRKEASALTLTPKPSPKPRINGPKVFGVRPRNPFLYTVPATGIRPMEFGADKLPAGLTIDRSTGRITGNITTRGSFPVVLRAKNALGTAERSFTIVVGDRIALTPPLGWNSWNCFASAVDDAKVRAAADALVGSGLADHGWTYINIDDCWEVRPGSTDPLLSGEERSVQGRINTNRKFPDMKALGEYVHSKGLKLGIYSSPGPLTCAGYTASYRHELDDARQYAEWGIDYLKYDWCSYGQIAKDQSIPELQKPYRMMRAALDSVRRDIVYSLCQYGMGNVWEWGAEVGGNSWRTTGDITDTWESMSEIGFNQAGHEKFAGPGTWNDPDMLVVGYVGWGPSLHPTRLSPHEQMTHITLWALLASPLLIGCDMTRLDDFTLSLLTNDEVLDVHQDALGKQAARIAQQGGLEVWAKDLDDGSTAVGLFNRGESAATVRARWSDLGLTGKYLVRDLWRQKDAGIFDNEFPATVARHGAVMIKLMKVHKAEN
jgi:alpha-galactosidase